MKGALATGDSVGVRSAPSCPSRVCPRWPLLGLWPHLSGLLCALVSLTLSTRPPPPRRRVPGGGAPRAAPAQRGAAPAEAAGPPARPAEPLLLSHPRGERRAAPGTSRRLQCSSWSPRGRGLRLPATPGAARLWSARASAPGFFGSCSFLPLQVWGGTVHGGRGQAWTPGLGRGGSWQVPDAVHPHRCMSSSMTRWTSPAALRSGPTPQPR